jgi:hypothetical protein
MKNTTLIIHPQDPSTTFLNDIYANIPKKTVVQGGVSKLDIKKMIVKHDRIMMMGHGSPRGLFSISQFKNTYGFIIDDEMISLLSKNSNNIFIWCYASQFLQNKNLGGFATGMLISEVSEAYYHDIKVADQEMVDESNTCFVNVISTCIDQSAAEILAYMMKSDYQKLAKSNPVAKYNFERFYYN